jgi:peptidoglycan/LPS O-acetylase OafA/YrhL
MITHAPQRRPARHAPHMQCYRPDIDGLRALAIAAVLAFHGYPAVVPGGFIGVDVFFVISGYLITGLIERDLRQGRFSMLDFYRRRVRRIVPALLAVLAFCCLVSWYVLTPVELAWFGKSDGWSAVFLGNAFAASLGGYFDAWVYPDPLGHLWSLAVEEQFYLVWPVLLVSAHRRQLTRRVLIAVVGTSFAISIWTAVTAPTVHFYYLSCRAWELGAGALIAVTMRTQGRAAGWIAALVGIALITGCSLFMSADQSFPGWWSLLPVLGAALVIAAGPGNAVNRQLLGSPVMTFVGRISYSLYLWHLPLLAFCRILAGRSLTALEVSGVLAAAFVAACSTYYLIENPIRFGRRSSAVTPALLTALAVLAVTGVAFAQNWLPARLSGPAVAELDRARTDWQFPLRHNPTIPFGARPVALAGHRAQTVLFVGDSHVQQYWPRVRYVVETNPETARSAEFATYVGCPPLPGVNVATPASRCDQFFDYAMQAALRSDVDTVVFGAYWEAYFLGEFATEHVRHPLYSVADIHRTPLRLDSPATQRAFAQFGVAVRRLIASGRRVFIILSNPTSPQFDPATMLFDRGRWAPGQAGGLIADRRLDATAFERFAAPVQGELRRIAMQTGAQILDPRDTLCDGLECAASDADGRPLYKDTNHVRASYARTHAGFIDQVLLSANAP